MAEQITLTAPVTPPTLSFWRVLTLHLHRGETVTTSEIHIVLRGTNGEFFQKTYLGQEATTLLNVLNTANLTVKSLERRVLEKFIADGLISGTIAGSPD